jgi:exopolysaccharide biosynthesis polyprenyl glycosylphosphotransferase
VATRRFGDRFDTAPRVPHPAELRLPEARLTQTRTAPADVGDDTVVFANDADTIVLDAASLNAARVAASRLSPAADNRSAIEPRPPASGSGAGRSTQIRPIRVPTHVVRRNRPRWDWEASYVRGLLISDTLVGLAAGATAFFGRFGQTVTFYNREYLFLSLAMPLALVAALALNRAYERRFLFVGTDEYQRVIRAGIALTASSAMVAYALDFPLARGYMLIALPFAAVGAVVGRFLLRKRLHRRRDRGSCLKRVIVVGHELAVIHITRQLRRERYHGFEVVGACLPPGHHDDVGLPVYGTFDDVAVAVNAAAADTVIVLSCPELDGHTLRRLAWQLERDDIELVVASSLIDVAGDRTTIRPVDGLPMLHVDHPRLTGAPRVFKEVFDRVGALTLIAVSAPLLTVLAVLIRLDSAGPVLFRQVRVGRHGREFVIYKFRTMYLDAEARLAELRHFNEYDGVLFKMRNDPRVTRVGRWLRRFSLDEVPQLFNVLRGQMSLVGPRPPLPEEVAAYPDDARRRLVVKPGMTGLWQVSGRSDLPWEEAVRLDLRYVENWSIPLDLAILLRTLTAVSRASGAY